MNNTSLYQSIRSEVDSIALFDTHEHLISERARLGQPVDLSSWFVHYASSDLVSAGLPEEALLKVQDPAVPLDQRWFLIEPHWAHARYTGYGRALLLAARDLFGIEDINRDTYQELSAKLAATNHEGWYDYVLKQRANISISILDQLFVFDPTPLPEIDRRFLAPAWKANSYILVSTLGELRMLEATSGRQIHSLDDLVSALDHEIEQAVAAGIAGIKVSVAYDRSLDFDKVPRGEAERAFNQLTMYPPSLTGARQPAPLSWSAAKPLQDYMMHQVVRRAIEHHLPLQIHTGLQEGNGNVLANSHPLRLVNLLIEYPEARFDLFHAGYPYQGEMATLGKNFPNAFVDLCWVHVISPWVARQTLHEWIETVPANKIFAFGGDYIFVEGAYAHAVMARENVTRVLVEKVESGYLSEDEALVLARKLLHDNAAQFFCLAG